MLSVSGLWKMRAVKINVFTFCKVRVKMFAPVMHT